MRGSTSKQFLSVITAVCMIILETVLLYLVPRSNFIATYSIFLLLFFLYFFVVQTTTVFSFSFCIGLAVILRLIALFNLPVLSDDYFRFIWDGRMNLAGVNTFQYTPQEYLQLNGTTPYLQHLYDNMNSQEFRTVYPPVMQFVFTLAAFIGKNNDWVAVLVMKVLIVAAELGTIRIFLLVTKDSNTDKRNMLWYILNPLIISELSGNVHFEGVMLFFFIGFLYFLYRKKIIFAALLFALAVCSKMIPFLLVPLIIRFIGVRKSLLFGIVSLAVCMLLFAPFFNWHLVNDLGQSLGLFFHLYEFNASVFYFIRWIGYFYVDYDIIEETAPVLAVISFIVILAISFWPAKKISFTEKSLWIFSVYFLFSTMVQPWYAAILILLAALSRFRFPLVFSLLVLLSYYPYSLKEYNEDNGLWLIAIEYTLLFVYITWEIFKWRKAKLHIAGPL